MKYLTVVRHAKSSWNQPGLADHDRPLNERGKRAAPAVGKFLWTTYLGGDHSEPLLPKPGCLFSSTALRALSTAQVMRDVFQMPPELLHLVQNDSRYEQAGKKRNGAEDAGNTGVCGASEAGNRRRGGLSTFGAIWAV